MGIRKDLFNMTTLAVQNRVLPEVVSVQAMSSALQYLPVLLQDWLRTFVLTRNTPLP